MVQDTVTNFIKSVKNPVRFFFFLLQQRAEKEKEKKKKGSERQATGRSDRAAVWPGPTARLSHRIGFNLSGRLRCLSLSLSPIPSAARSPTPPPPPPPPRTLLHRRRTGRIHGAFIKPRLPGRGGGGHSRRGRDPGTSGKGNPLHPRPPGDQVPRVW